MTEFGWRVPGFPVDGTRPRAFVEQITTTLEALRGPFVSAWVADHFLPWADFQEQATDTYECWTTLCYLAGLLQGYTFGSIVLSQSYRSPALVAKMAATLQSLTGSRLVLGLGAGWKEDEYLAYGYEFPSPAIRVRQMAEAVQIVRMMWTQPRATFHGRYYHVEEAICEPKPAPLPPIMIGGGGRKLTLRFVAQHADWWNYAGGSPEEYGELLEVLRGHCEQAGRDYERIVKTWACDCVAVASSAAEARRMAQASPFYDQTEAIVGTPDEVAAQLRRFTALGVEHFMLRFADFPSLGGAQLFAKEVIPRFA